jgi:hypothetical protein
MSRCSSAWTLCSELQIRRPSQPSTTGRLCVAIRSEGRVSAIRYTGAHLHICGALPGVVKDLARVEAGRAQLGGGCRFCRTRVVDGCEPSAMRPTTPLIFASGPLHARCAEVMIRRQDTCLERDLELNRSVHHWDERSRLLSPENGIGSAIEIVEEVLDSGAGVEWLVPVVFEVLIAPVQGSQTGGPGVVQAGDWEAGPVGSEILAPRRPAFANGQMPWGDVAFDADLAADVLGNWLAHQRWTRATSSCGSPPVMWP